MLVFAFPFWLIAFAPVAVVGVLALRRRWPAAIAVPTLRFWPPSNPRAGGGKTLNWRWLPLILAALLIILTLAGPVWNHRAATIRSVPVYAVMRTSPDGRKAELFVKIEQAELLAPDEQVEVILRPLESPGPHMGGGLPTTGPAPLVWQRMSAPALARGMNFTMPPAEQSVLSLRQSDREVARCRISRVRSETFVIVDHASSPALKRVLQIQPGAVEHASPGAARVALLDASTAANDWPARAAGDLRIIIGRVPLEGVEFLGSDHAPGDAPPQAAGVPLMNHVDLAGVQVRRLTPAKLAGDWQTLISIDGLPLAALKKAPTGGRILWLSAPLTPEVTNWPLHPSFVVFFTNLISDWRLTSADAADWQVTDAAPPPASPCDLARWTGGAAVLCLLIGLIFLQQRTI
jgi:hypothetical protein